MVGAEQTRLLFKHFIEAFEGKLSICGELLDLITVD
jgi:hypothetical protein